jgi:tetratricopeptide (TPR) repeat protein
MYFSFNGGPVFDLSVKPKATTEPPAQTATANEPANEGAPSAAASSAPVEDAADFARRGEALESRRDFDQALAELNHACELAPDNAEYLFRRGVIHQELRQPVLAMSDFDRSLQLRPNDLNTLLLRAELRIRTGDKAGGRADLDAADAVAPRQANEHFRMALAYEHAGQSDTAISQMGLWIDSHDRDAMLPSVLNERCWVRALEGIELPMALKDCTAALRLTDKSTAIYARIVNSRGLVYLRMGDVNRSIADYTTAVKANPKDAWSWYGRGIDNLKKHQTQEGNADIAQAMALWPGVAEEFKRRGIFTIGN